MSSDGIVTTEINDDLDKFLDRSWGLLKRHWNENADPEKRVFEVAPPEKIADAVKVALDDTTQAGFDELYDSLEQVCRYSVRTSHPRFMNMLYGCADIYGILGEVFATFLNTNIHTFEVSPVFTLMEVEVMSQLCKYMGYENGDGVFAPGGSFCNMFGMLMARNQACPEIRMDGFGGKTLVCFTSKECHYSVQKGANLIGIGMRNVVGVACNDIGQMIPAELEKAVEQAKKEGKTPFMVNSTAGTTVKGAFDDFNAIADVCEKHGLWLHVDGAWGGSAVMSAKRQHLCAGISRADSITWDPHKGMGVPIQCSVVLTKKKGVLAACNQFKAEYLFKDANLENIVSKGGADAEKAAAELAEKKYDLGDKSLQCGRHVDSLKMWLMLKRHGKVYFENRVENGFRNRDHMMVRLAEKPEAFELVSEPMYLNLCFWFIPPSCRALANDDPVRKQKIDVAVQSIRRSLYEEGIVYINYQPQGDLPNFFRPIFNSASTTTKDIDILVERIEHFGNQL
ncbi:Glutamate decarboxylase [Diplonema papillatum]|nr:Glutamate decarboxylase [Diplonema papillatum]